MSTPDRTTPVATPPAMEPRAALSIGRLRRLTGSWVPAALIVLVLLGTGRLLKNTRSQQATHSSGFMPQM